MFEKEILPFCVSTGGKVPLEIWNKIKDEKPNPYNYSGRAGTDAYDTFKRHTKKFADMLPGIVNSISTEAQRFYDEHFSEDDTAKVTLKLGVTSKPTASGSNQHDFTFIRPVIEFGVQIDGETINRPQTFLNEAKLTQLALSVRFGASLVNLYDSDLKLLVLGGLLVSLDMSNRMKVVEILLSDTFANYQKIILTHDLGFFREFRRTIGDAHEEWRFMSLAGDASKGISVRNEKSAIEKAEDYLNHHDLEEAAVWMRKAAEDSSRRFRAMAEGKQPPPGEFHSLTKNLRTARNKLREKLPIKLYEGVLKVVPEEHRDKLVRVNDDDIDADDTLDPATKEMIKTQRARLASFLNKEGWRHLEAIETLDAILKMTDRVLNPAAHWGEPALYDTELQKALTLIRRLEKIIHQSVRPGQ